METQYPLKIEFVCTANHGRSVPSEIIANQHLIEIGAYHMFQAISSGTSVDDIASGNLGPDTMLKFVKKGLNRGVYGEERSLVEDMTKLEAKEIESRYQSDPAFNAALKSYYGKAVQIFMPEEHASRDEALKSYFERKKQIFEEEGMENRNELLNGLELMIEEGLSKRPDQTVVRDDVIAIFPMAESNQKAVKNIYEQAERQTPHVFDTPKSFVLENSDAIIPDCFGEEGDKYRQMFADLVEFIPRATVKGIFYALAHDLAVKMDINNPANK